MKKVLFSLLALLALGGSVKAQTVSVDDVEALPGETVSFAVSLSDGLADTYTAMTLYVQFPATGFSTTGAATLSSDWEDATKTVGDTDDTGLAIIPCSSANAIPGTSVENLIIVSFKVDESVALGEYEVTLKQTLFEYNIRDKAYADDVTFKVNVVGAHTVVLDEASTTVPAAATNVNVRVKRSIKAGLWSTICLPFAMTEAQMREAFGSDVELGDFNGYETEKDDGGDIIVGISVKFNEATAIEANHPYIIKVSSAITEFSVDGVDVDPEDEPTVAAVQHTKKAWSEMTGTYVANTVIEENCLFLNDGMFRYSTGATKMKGYRAYFDFYDVMTSVEEGSASKAQRIAIVFNSDGTTGLRDDLQSANSPSAIYDLSGRKVADNIQSNDRLPKGLYIKDNKKVVIK